MAQFSNVTYDAEQGTVTLGVALTWDQVYEHLEPLGVMVVGGRISGVGKFLLRSALNPPIPPIFFSYTSIMNIT